MIWKDPVFKDRDIQTWLDPDSGFLTGTAELVAEMGHQPLEKKFLKGHLVRLREDGGKEEGRVAKVLASVSAHADLAICLIASRVPKMIMEREDHPATDLPLSATIEMTDVLLLLGFGDLYERDVKMMGGLISQRAFPPSRLTILLLPKQNAPAFDTALSLFRGRRTDLWPKSRKRNS